MKWNYLPQEERQKLLPCMIEAQILHIEQCKEKAVHHHRAHMKELDSWLKNLKDDLRKHQTATDQSHITRESKMIHIKEFKIYLGTPKWGWFMFGIGWGTKWFLGFSCKDSNN